MANGSDLERTFSYQALKIILYALLLTPLWVWSGFLFPYITSKIIYFRVLAEIAFAFYLLLALRFPELRPRWNFLSGAVWAYLAAIFAASLVGLNFNRSFWGTVERGEGIVTILHFVLYFVVLSAVLRTDQAWRKYLFWAINSTAAVSVYGLFQLLKFSFVIPAVGTRITGTIGNASFFAAFLLFGIFLSLYLLQFETASGKRLYLKGVFLFEIFLLFQSQTRGALLALALAFVLYASYFAFFSTVGRSRRYLAAGLLAAIILSGILIYTNRNASWVRANNTLYRLATISPRDITTQSRLDTWKASYAAWQDRLVAGYGYENYNLGFNKYFPARIFRDQGSQIWFDRAHNIFFDIVVTSGLLGLVTYLAIFSGAFFRLYKYYKIAQSHESNRKSAVILAVLLIAYFFQNLFVFDTQATYLVFFIILAHLSFLQHGAASSIANKAEADSGTAPAGMTISVSFKRFFARSFRPNFFIQAGLAVLIAFAAYQVNLKPAAASYYTTRAIYAAKTKQYRTLKGFFERALSYRTYMDEEVRQKLADYAREAMTSGQLSPADQQEFHEYVVSELEKSIRSSPQDVRNHLYLMAILNQRPQGEGNLARVGAVGAEALEYSPTRPQIYFELGQMEFFRKDYEAGLENFRKAIALNPEPKESHLNYLLAGIVAKRPDIVESEKQIIADLGHSLNLQDYLSLARAYAIVEDKPKIAEAYEHAVKLSPSDPDLRAKLAAAYGDLCEIAKAREEVLRAVELDASFGLEAQEFLRTIEKNCQK